MGIKANKADARYPQLKFGGEGKRNKTNNPKLNISSIWTPSSQASYSIFCRAWKKEYAVPMRLFIKRKDPMITVSMRTSDDEIVKKLTAAIKTKVNRTNIIFKQRIA